MGNTLSSKGQKKKECPTRLRLEPLAAIADSYAAADLARVRIPVALGPGLPHAAHVNSHDGSIRPHGIDVDSPSGGRLFEADSVSDNDSVNQRRHSRSPMAFGSACSRTFPYPHQDKQGAITAVPSIIFWPSHILQATHYSQCYVLSRSLFQSGTQINERASEGVLDENITQAAVEYAGSEVAQNLAIHAGALNMSATIGTTPLPAASNIVYFSKEECTSCSTLFARVASDSYDKRLSLAIGLHSAVLGHVHAAASNRMHGVHHLDSVFSEVQRPAPIGLLSMEIGMAGAVDLSGLGISVVSTDVACFQGLTVLVLSRNALETVPEQIGLLTGLRTLRLSENRITQLPESIGGLCALKSLHVDRNRLTHLPRSIGRLSRLRTLNIAFNSISSIPREAGKLTRLHTLEAEHNNIAWLPAELAAIESIRRIQLGGNPLVRERDVGAVEAAVSALAGPALLQETAARCVLLSNAPVPLTDHAGHGTEVRLPLSLKLELTRHESCTFCGGPMLRRGFLRIRHVWRHEQHIPFGYWLCEAHWNNERERCIALFEPRSSTVSAPLLPNGPCRKSCEQRHDSFWRRRAVRGNDACHANAEATRDNAHASLPSLTWIHGYRAQRSTKPPMPQYDVVEDSDALVLCERSWSSSLQAMEGP